ncbi:MAG: metallophosphoesterase, partial [Fimbriimonadaceae bacterium]
MSDYTGLLFIGDPHLAHRNIGFRKDDYARAVLTKLAWSLDYARENRLLPCILGDLFHTPRDNANWLIGEVCQLLVGREVLAIYGNHDIHEASLQENDTFSVLVSAQLLRLVSESDFWAGEINGRNVIIGGSSYGQFWSDTFWPGVKSDVLVFWMTHHDLQISPEDRSNRKPEEISGIDVVVNGHLHMRKEDLRVRKTLWINPGNMTRTSRSERTHAPAILRVDIAP